MHHYNVYPSIRFHTYHLIARCTLHGRRPIDEKKTCCFYFQDPATMTPVKLYTGKELVLMEKSVAGFHTSFYIPAIKNLVFHISCKRILRNNHCGNTRCEAFTRRSIKKYVLCHHDYAEKVVASFSHKIHSE